MKTLRMAAGVLALGCLLQMPAGASGSTSLDAAKPGVVGHGSPQRPGRRLTVTGRLTGEGVECQALRSKNGVLYTLTGKLGRFKAGDRVRVVGRVAEMSTCMQGTTLVVESIGRASR